MAAALCLTVLGVAPAHADGKAAAPAPSSAFCFGEASVSYSPGLTFTRTQVTGEVAYEYSNCRIVNEPGVTSGSFHWTKNMMESCADLDAGPPFTYDMPIMWNDGTMSVATVSVTRDLRLPWVAFTLTGTVHTGHFTGDSLSMELVFLNTPDLSVCNSPGGLTLLAGVLWLKLTP